MANPIVAYYQSSVEGRGFICEFKFTREEVKDLFFCLIDIIKRYIEDLNTAYEASEIDYELYVIKLRLWLQKCEDFISLFGSRNVPLDIRWAIRDVQSNLGCPLTDFPEPNNDLIHYID